MENIASIEVNEERQGAPTLASAPTLHTTGRNIDGFFRPRTTTTPRTINKPVVKNSIAVLASAPEIHITATQITHGPKKPSTTRLVNHTRAHTPQAPKSRTILVSHTTTSSQPLAVHRGQPNHVRHHVTQHSKTLRRDTVPIPEQSTHNALRPNGTLQHKAPGLIEVKQAADMINSDRLVRASSLSKNPLVTRHTVATAPALSTMFTSIAIQPTPTPANPPVAPPPTPGNDGVPPAPAPMPDNKPTDIFEHALANANHYVDLHAHKASYRKKARTHVMSMAFGSLALIMLASIVAYQNSPSLQLKIASARAGISTDMPNFTAAGFAYNGVKSNDNGLTFGFKGDKGSTYELTQTNTNFDDASMIQAIASTNANGTPMYQVVMAGNTVVYRFNNTNATWVSDGQWYTLSGTNALTNKQVAALVQHT